MLYSAPLDELRFWLTSCYQDVRYQNASAFDQFDLEQAHAVLNEAANFAERQLAPLNVLGDRQGAQWRDGEITLPSQFHQAYQRFCEQGWPTLRAQAAQGGMQVPQLLASLIEELWCSANLSFRLAPMLSRSAVEAITLRGNAFLKTHVLPKLVTGEWTGTMNLTEPQAGSDVGAIKTKVVQDGTGYWLKGQKCYITYGEHTLTPNIVHLILARVEGAAPGTKGLSLFVVPKYRLSPLGEMQQRNDVRCLSIERKMGLHASPTCVMSYGESDGSKGAQAFIVGQEGEGMEIMFIMMNLARLAVGIEGHALGERALQMAQRYASQRVQGRVFAKSKSHAIESHPDVKRMLLEMDARVQAARALAVYAASEWDGIEAQGGDGRVDREARLGLLIPMVKAFGTETGSWVASLNIQVHGGMGYIEDTGAAQLYRDARIGAIYEGTNGIQALDYLTRKVLRDEGRALASLIDDMQADVTKLRKTQLSPEAHQSLVEAIELLRSSSQTMRDRANRELEAALSLAVPFLMLSSLTVAGWRLARAMGVEAYLTAPETFQQRKLTAAETFLRHSLAEAWGLARRITLG